MSKAQDAARPGWGARLATMAFSGVFMLGFGAGGVLAGVVPITLTLWRAVEVSGWQPVSAQVLETKLDVSRSSKGGSTYAVRARYAYRVNGRDLEGRRVGLLDWGSDNVGTWHEDWHARLEDARQREQPVAAWVDPSQPERSILDRRVRWGLMALHLPFALLFTAVGVGAAVVFWRALTGRGDLPSKSARGTAAPSRRSLRAPADPGEVARGVRGRLDRDAGVVVFRRWWPRAVAAAMALPMLLWLASGPSTAGGGERLLLAGFATLWLAVALHLATLRWTWQRQDDGLLLVRRSWLHARRWSLDRSTLARAESVLVFTSSTNGGPQVQHHRLAIKLDGGRQLALTPALDGPEAVAAVRQHLQLALAPTKRPR